MTFNPKENDEYCLNLLESSETEDLFDWLSMSDDIERTLGEFSTQVESEQFVAELLNAGAQKVWAADIERATEDYKCENSGKLCIKLPEDKYVREELLAFANEIAEENGYDSVPDYNQEYLYVALD